MKTLIVLCALVVVGSCAISWTHGVDKINNKLYSIKWFIPPPQGTNYPGTSKTFAILCTTPWPANSQLPGFSVSKSEDENLKIMNNKAAIIAWTKGRKCDEATIGAVGK